MIGSCDWESSSSTEIVLIDFGIAKRFTDDDGEHVKQSIRVPFSGNFLYASKNSFARKTLSRRDDLHSLVFLVLFLINGEFTWMKDINLDDLFLTTKIGAIKKTLTPEMLCVGSAVNMHPFVREIFSIKFS